MTHFLAGLSSLLLTTGALASTCFSQKPDVGELIAEAQAAHVDKRRDDAAMALHRAALACDVLTAAQDETRQRIETLAKVIDPRLGARREVEREIAKSLVTVAGLYRDRKLPRCAVDLLRDANRLDPTVEDELLRTEGLVGKQPSGEADVDEALHRLLWKCFHPYGAMMLFGRRTPPREEARREDADFETLRAARAQSATALLKQARVYADAGLWCVAFSLANEAICIEPEPSFPLAQKLAADYRKPLAVRAAEQRKALLKQATRKGRWKKKGKTGLSPPDLGDRPGLILSKATLKPPYRVQVDVSLNQQPGGGGMVVGARDTKNYLAVELNTIGMGMSVYLTYVAKGERKVIAGSAVTHGSSTPKEVRGIPEHAYNAARLGLPMTLTAEVKNGEIIVSSLLHELFRTKLPAGVTGSGSYGLVRVAYGEKKKKSSKKRRRSRAKYTMQFDHLLVDGGS